MSIENPPLLEYGFTEGRFVTAVADTLSDEGREPDWAPMTGFLRLVPLKEIHLMSGVIPTTVGKRPVRVDLNEQGYVVDAESAADPELKPGVKLPVGQYRVEFNLDMASMTSYTIEVTPEHTKDNPLNLTRAAPLTPPPGFIEVVRVADRVRAEEAAGAAEEQATLVLTYRDEAAQSAATAQAHSTNAGESAEAAEGHANRAEAARDDTLAQAIEVDTSAGVAVRVGGHLVSYESGTRSLPILYENGWSDGGYARVTRSGNFVYVAVNVDGHDPEQSEQTSSFQTVCILPHGFRSTSTVLSSSHTYRGATVRTLAGSSGWLQIQNPNGSNDFFELIFITSDSLPTTLPGTPV